MLSCPIIIIPPSASSALVLSHWHKLRMLRTMTYSSHKSVSIEHAKKGQERSDLLT